MADALKSNLAITASARDLVRMKCQEGPYAHGWLEVIPSQNAETNLDNADFNLLVKWWLGEKILPASGVTPKCPMCGAGSVDAFGDHLVCCYKNGISKRHNILRDGLLYICRRLEIPFSLEQSC